MLKANGAVRELRLWLPAAAQIPAVRLLQQHITMAVGGVTRFDATGTDEDGFEEPILYLHWIAFTDRAAVRASGLLRVLAAALLTEGQNSVLVDYGAGDGPTLYYDEPISG